MRTRFLLPIAAAGLFVAAGSAQALTIDSFGVENLSVTHTVAQGTTPLNTTATQGPAATTEIVGGYRTYNFTTTWNGGGTGSGDGRLRINNLGDSRLSVANDPDTDSDVIITWDANGAGLGGADLLNGTGDPTLYAMVLNVPSIDAAGVTIKFDITETAAAGGSTASGQQTFFSAGQLFIAFSAFTNAAAVNFSQVLGPG